jgi:squalene synthase HpnC
MSAPAFQHELARYGPEAAAGTCDRAAARAYCRRLARTHYENFSVATWLLPRRLRPHFYHVYAYCRWADDLADETGDRAESLKLLDWWEAELRACYEGEARHPVFVALADTIAEFDIPAAPFLDLLTAFRRDQQQTRYETPEEVRDYCRCSADPVGRLVLYLGRCANEEYFALSDAICTGLQLANFCQDVARDWDERGRIYLPMALCRAEGYTEEHFARHEMNAAFRRVMKGEVERAERLLLEGLPLARRVPRELRVDVELFARGGLAILAAIRKLDYDVWATRPEVSRRQKLGLLLSAWRRGGAA